MVKILDWLIKEAGIENVDNAKRIMFPAAIITFVILILLIFLASYMMGYGTHRECLKAQAIHKGSCTTALLSVVNDERSSIKDKDLAIWAIGQIGNPEAITALQAHQTDEECPRKACISQFEIQKAIDLCSGKLNAAGKIWKLIFKLE